MESRPVEESSLTSKTRQTDLPSSMRTSSRSSISSWAGSSAMTGLPSSISSSTSDSTQERAQASTPSRWPGHKTKEKAQSTIIKTELVIATSIADQPLPPSMVVTVDRPSTSISSRVITPPPSAEPTPASQTNQQPGHTEEHPPLSNGATAGIVLAVVAVLLGVFFLVCYVYKRRRFCGRRRSFSPVLEPYHHPTPGPTTRPFPPIQRPCSWLSESCERPYPNGVMTPTLEESVELQTFTRPQFGPRMYDFGCSGNAPLMPAHSGHPVQCGHSMPDTQGQVAEPLSPQETGQDMALSPERPSMGKQHRGAHARRRTGQIPLGENYRC